MLVIAALHLIGGWFYSAGFKRDVLDVGPKPRPAEIVVRDLTGTTVTLEAPGPRQDIGHPGTLSMYWEGGFAQVHEVTEVAGNRITRGYELLTGEDPPVCSDQIDRCEAVNLGGYAYPTGPSDVGLAFEETSYETPLGPMGAWVVPGDSSDWALHIHGWTAHRREAIRLLGPIHDVGWNSMVIDYRNDVGAPADPSGMYRFGLTEWKDVEAAVRNLLAKGAERIVLVGYSTGAAHAMAFLERSDIAVRIDGLVFDSPNIELVETVRFGSRDSRFPVVNIPISRLVAEFGLWLSDLRWHVDWESTNYLQRAEATIRVPTLLFHGSADQRVPVSVGQRLAARIPRLVTYVETPAAGHVMSWNANHERYENELRGFLRSL